MTQEDIESRQEVPPILSIQWLNNFAFNKNTAGDNSCFSDASKTVSSLLLLPCLLWKGKTTVCGSIQRSRALKTWLETIETDHE